MRDAVGGSMLFYIVIIFVTAVMLLFSSIMTYSKAYRIKNRILEVIEKYGEYTNEATEEINIDLSASGYNSSYPSNCEKIRNRLIGDQDGRYASAKISENQNKKENNLGGYNYCVFKLDNVEDGYSYIVVTFTEFQIPVIGEILTFPVYGETQTLGRTYGN